MEKIESVDGEVTTGEAEDVIGEHEYMDVLYTGRQVERAIDFAERTTDPGEAPRVAKRNYGPRPADSAPFGSAMFGHFSITGSLENHLAFLDAWNRSEFEVEIDADYETGDLEIVVRRDNE